MHVLLVDEANMPPKEGQFFLYGGLIVEATEIPKLSRKVDVIRQRYGYGPGDNLKFSNQSGIDADTHVRVKKKVLRQIEKAGGQFIVNVVLDRILASQEPTDYAEKAINVITQRYHEFLTYHDSHGIVLMDRVDRSQVNKTLNDMASRFQSGLQFPEGYRKVNDRILLFGMTNNNSSNLSSCADIVLGSFSYVVNSVTGHAGASPEVARKIAPHVGLLHE